MEQQWQRLGRGEGEGIVSHVQPKPAHAQMKLHALACHLQGLVPNGPWTLGLYNRYEGMSVFTPPFLTPSLLTASI